MELKFLIDVVALLEVMGMIDKQTEAHEQEQVLNLPEVLVLIPKQVEEKAEAKAEVMVAVEFEIMKQVGVLGQK